VSQGSMSRGREWEGKSREGNNVLPSNFGINMNKGGGGCCREGDVNLCSGRSKYALPEARVFPGARGFGRLLWAQV